MIYDINLNQKISFLNATKQYEIPPRPKVQRTLLANFIEDFNESELKIFPFCMNGREKNESKG